ncbi:type I phosphatidylinositol 4,5-bisphosphate 4-phosphatase-B-like [Ornithodoros turicata]|uniref:type I phosphatidylinositol 4,5-bisphosphate 4-phosphatase-B-like n=1 Tax=Ornithodoros turicata TaxID=34597 RepID=UPI003139217A
MARQEADAERAPLLRNSQNEFLQQGYGDIQVAPGQQQGVEEPPPLYSPPYNGIQGNVVPCRVCGEVIDITNQKNQHVVRCSRCNEATPIRNAPPGKKYVRCPCNCLLICNVTSQRIGCPRPNCKRIINLAPNTASIPQCQLPGLCRVCCVHCQENFLFNTLSNALARCPHCRKVSSVGPEYARGRGILSLILAAVFLAITLGVLLGTYQYAASKKGIYVAYIGGFIAFLLFLARGLYYFTMRVSDVEGPA